MDTRRRSFGSPQTQKRSPLTRPSPPTKLFSTPRCTPSSLTKQPSVLCLSLSSRAKRNNRFAPPKPLLRAQSPPAISTPIAAEFPQACSSSFLLASLLPYFFPSDSSFLPQHHHRVQLRRTSRRQVRRHQRNSTQQNRNTTKSRRIRRRHAKKHAAD